MTLIELTVVILVLLSMVTILFFGAQAWKRGSDRALCIIHIRNVQHGVRSYANLNGYQPGSSVPNLTSRIIGFGHFVPSAPVCPGNGVYSYGGTLGADTIPLFGSLYMECSLANSQQHEPDVTPDW
jgi:hypothetical protein